MASARRQKHQQPLSTPVRGAQARQRWLPAVMANLTDGLLVLDSSRRIRYCNPQLAKLLGLDTQAIQGRSDRALFHLGRSSLRFPEAAWAMWEEALAQVDARPRFFVETIPEGRDTLVEVFPVRVGGHAAVGVLLKDGTAEKQLALLKEREHLAMDLHDGVMQSLYALCLALEGRARKSARTADIPGTLRWAIGQVQRAISDVRSSILGLRERDTGAHGLPAAFDGLAEELRACILVQPEIEVAAQAEAALEPEAVDHLLYVAREAVANIIRHSSARAVSLRLTTEGKQVVLAVQDDGCGFDAEQTTEAVGEGLHNMRERARIIEGQLAISSGPGHGTEVRLTVPLRS